MRFLHCKSWGIFFVWIFFPSAFFFFFLIWGPSGCGQKEQHILGPAQVPRPVANHLYSGRRSFYPTGLGTNSAWRRQQIKKITPTPEWGSSTMKMIQWVNEKTPQPSALEDDGAEVTAPPVRWRCWTWEHEVSWAQEWENLTVIRKTSNFLQIWVQKHIDICTVPRVKDFI